MSDLHHFNATSFNTSPQLEHCGDETGEPRYHVARSVRQRQVDEPGAKAGDTEYSICKKYGISYGCFRKWNNLPRQKDQANVVISVGRSYVVGYQAKPAAPPPQPQPVAEPVKPIAQPVTPAPQPKPPVITQPVDNRLLPSYLKASERCLTFIRSFERPHRDPATGQIIGRVYRDSKGNRTIGFGHYIPEDQAHLWAEYDPELGGTREMTLYEMERLFQQDVASIAEAPIRKRIMVPLRQHEYDALVDLCFHRGGRSLQDSGLQDLINRAPDGRFDYQDIEAAFMVYANWFNKNTNQWEYVEGFARRRRKEIEMFRDGIYTDHV